MLASLDAIILRYTSIISYNIATSVSQVQITTKQTSPTMLSMAAIYIRSLSKEQRRAIIGVSCILGLSLSAVFSSFKSKQHNGTQYVGSVRRSLFSSEGVEWAFYHPKKRLALIRPFSVGEDAQKLLESFSLWDDWWPCSAEDNEYDIDLVLSYSRRFNNNDKDDLDAKLASDIVQEIRSKFIADNGWGWSECFAGLRVIEADLDVSVLLSCIILVLQFIYSLFFFLCTYIMCTSYVPPSHYSPQRTNTKSILTQARRNHLIGYQGRMVNSALTCPSLWRIQTASSMN